MRIAILGYGMEGHSAYNYWNTADNQITICDQDAAIEIPSGVNSKLGSTYLEDLKDFDLLVRSPGLHPKDIAKANSQDILTKVTTVTNEFFKTSPTKNIIGVTGTKGKGTTSTLITKLLKASGHQVFLAGNIGKSSIDLLKEQIQPQDWVVLELSNFQLIDLKYSPHIAVCLLVVEEHLDWHSDINEYINAKKNIFAHQKSTDIAVYYADNQYSKDIAEASPAHKIAYFDSSGARVENDQFVIGSQVICKISEIKLLGKHNWQNICAALTVYWQVDQDYKIAREVITNFSGLEHRLELVREANGIKFFNDSFASGPEASSAAIDAIPGQKVLIIGGFDRGLSLSKLADAIQSHTGNIKRVILIGASADRMATALQQADFSNFEINRDRSMSEIVGKAKQIASPGEAVVLSPGFASFDMFKNFEDRGNQFKMAVNAL